MWLLGYSYSKRFTSLAHFWLGVSLSLAPIAAWIALRGDLAWPPVFLALAVLFWVSGFDIIYACQDVDFDRTVGLRSVPKTLGVRRALWIAAACHALMIVPLVGLGLVYPLGPIYFVGVAAVAALLDLRARPGPSRRPDAGQRRVLPGQCRDQHGAARRRRGRPVGLMEVYVRRNPWRLAFPTTRWSRVIRAGDPADPAARTALEDLCRDYWFPLYAFVRRHGVSPDEAEDIVQGFLADLLERGDLASLDRVERAVPRLPASRLRALPGQPSRPRSGRQTRWRNHDRVDRPARRREPLRSRAGP